MVSRVDRLRERFLATLAANGPTRASDLCARLGISQPTFSRLARVCVDGIIVAGRGRATLYAACRTIAGVSDPIPVYELRPHPETPRLLMSLRPIAPRGFYAQASGTEAGDRAKAGNREAGTWFADLPWFLDGLRPSGFLGRLDALRHPELGHPPDIRLWSADDVLRFVTRYGWDLPGAFIVGEAAYRLFLRHAPSPPNLVDRARRRGMYPGIAAAVLEFGSAGSSAAGEQPKFLATLVSRRAHGSTAELTPVLVKFSPPVSDATSRRIADLLVAEHLALETLRDNGFPSPVSTALTAGGRTFLEIRRFDRQGVLHRIGQVSLESLDAEFVGSDQRSWSTSVARLAALGWVEGFELDKVRWLELFGRLIGNTDMHFGNLAFFLDGTRPIGLAPPYDMLPMHYYPRHQELPARPFPLPELNPDWEGVATGAIHAAADFWQRVTRDPRVSSGLRRIAARDRKRVLALASLARFLPRSKS